jgi:hypothetical protein
MFNEVDYNLINKKLTRIFKELCQLGLKDIKTMKRFLDSQISKGRNRLRKLFSGEGGLFPIKNKRGQEPRR